MADLSWEAVKEIRAMYVAGALYAEIEDRFPYGNKTLNNVCRNHTWVDPDYVPPPPRRAGLVPTLSAEFGEEMWRLHYEEFIPISHLARDHGLSSNQMNSVIRKVRERKAQAS